jgi:hypothetical protein
MMDAIEIWEHILSRDPDLIQKAYSSLNKDERQSLMGHLVKMTTETGWHPEQKESALIAMKIIEE